MKFVNKRFKRVFADDGAEAVDIPREDAIAHRLIPLLYHTLSKKSSISVLSLSVRGRGRDL